MIVLGIETSCDETSAAIVGDDRRILADEVLSQLDDHRPFGGIVPEIDEHLIESHRVEDLVAGVLEPFGKTGGIAAGAFDQVGQARPAE